MRWTVGKTDLMSAIERHAFSGKLPDDVPYQGIGTASVVQLSSEFNTVGWKIEQTALENEIIPERYTRNRNIISREDQIRLLGSTVSVVGLGGLGGALAGILARGGVGSLRLIDGDRFEESNLNRQLFSTVSDIGKSKAEVAGKCISQINPSVDVSVHDVDMNEKNASELIQGVNVAVDCLDTVDARFVLESAAKAQGIPLVSAAIGGETGHVTTIFPEDSGLITIYGRWKNSGKKEAGRGLGSPPHAVSLVSSLESTEVFKVLLGRTGMLKNQLLILDLNCYTFEIIQL
jgi:molybdopterin-synthase adenylyltransferase